MMHPSWWARSGLALVAPVLVFGLVTAVGHAQQPVTLMLTVTENRAPGAGGQVTMTPLPNNQLRVDIRATDLPAGEQRAAHIHTAQGARCDTGAPITYPLSNVQVDGSGVGTSSTTITLTVDQPIQANNAYVNIHQNNVAQGGGPGQGVICANVTTSFQAGGAAAGAAAGGQAAAAPRTGTGGVQADTGMSAGLLAGLIAAVLLLGGPMLLAGARRGVRSPRR